MFKKFICFSVKDLLIIGLLFLFSWPLQGYSQGAAITGKVVDALSRDPLPGATVSIQDLRASSLTGNNGEFAFRNVPLKGKFLIEVKYVGYRSIIQVIDVAASSPLEFALQRGVIEAHEVVITGSALSSDNRKNSTNVTSLNREELTNRPSSNLVDALTRINGVSQVTTGAGISKPVIRGLSYNRVITLVDGAKQEGQQWGDEHGIEVDQYSTGRVEVLRGAASLLYGSDALGGVINILDPLPPSSGLIRGEFLTNYATNNGQTGSSLMLEGNHNGFTWRGRGSYKNAYAFNTPDGRIPNTGYNEANFSGQLGLNKSWGYTHLNISSFKNKIGLPDFQRNPDGQFEDNDGIVFTPERLTDRNLLLPFQDVRHYKIALTSNFIFNSGHLKSVFAYQDNQRRELEVSRNDPSLFFDLKTYSYDLKYYFTSGNDWEPVIGISGAFQNNKNKAEEMLIPDYTSSDAGAFIYVKKNWTKSTFNTGIRYNYRDIRGEQMLLGGITKFRGFTNTFSNLSAAAGMTHEFTDQLTLKANAGSAFRSPNIAELGSEGVHEGTFRFEIGNSNLKPEKSYYADISLEYDSDKVHAALSAFRNYIDDYIYYRHALGEDRVENGETFPVFRYVQDNAVLSGAEASLTLHPINLIHFDNNFSYTKAENRASGIPLPFIPAARIRNELRIEPDFSSARMKNSYVFAEVDNVLDQDRIDIFETPTDGYSLINIGLGTTFIFNRQEVRVNTSVNNLFNKAYTDHLSRLKYEGILNTGRNITIGFVVPFNIHTQ